MSVTIDIGSAVDLANAIGTVDAATSGAFVFDFGANITLSAQLGTIGLGTGVTLTIEGNGDTLDGGGIYEGLFVNSGALTINNLTIADAVAQGGNSVLVVVAPAWAGDCSSGPPAPCHWMA